MTKTGLHVFSELLRQQLAGTPVQVIELIPPMVDTELNKEGREKLNLSYRGVSVAAYIATVIEGLESDLLEILYTG